MILAIQKFNFVSITQNNKWGYTLVSKIWPFNGILEDNIEYKLFPIYTM